MSSVNRVSLSILIIAIGLTSLCDAQRSNRRPKIEILREIDLEEGRQRLQAFRQMWVIGDFSVKYSLQFIPRRGKRQEVEGTLWSSNTNSGPVSLIKIQGESEKHLYLQNGPFASVSRKPVESEAWEKISVDEWFAPVDQILTLTSFDLMMPYIYWREWRYEGVTKIRGRVAHAFFMEAPESLDGNPIELSGVVVFLDEDFNALLKADYVTKDDLVLKSFRLLDLKKVSDVWLPKTVDFLDENTRDKTRLVIRQAAMNRDFSGHSLGMGDMPQGVPEIPLFDYVDVQ